MHRRLEIMFRTLRLLTRYPLRSALLTLCAVLGVAGVVCSVNYGAAGNQQVLDQIRRLGTNVLIITPTESRAIAGRARTGATVTTLVEGDYHEIQKELPTRTRSSAVVSGNFRVKVGDLSKATTILGCEPDYFLIKDWRPIVGNIFTPAHERSVARVALIGRTVAIDLFGAHPPVGQRLMINRVPFEVIGVLTERGQGLDVANEDNQIYVPLSTAMRRLMNVDHYNAIVLEINSASAMDSSEEHLSRLLRTGHRLREGKADDFQIQNQKTLLDTQTAAAARLNFFLRWIAASALTVSGLGLVAITWIAVKERTREIGTRRALGAMRPDIFFQIAFESAALSLAGALLGLALSWPVSRLIEDSSHLPRVFERSAAIFAFSIALALHLSFTLLPAGKAAKVSPIEALRYE